jgi:O-antigen/teichoic acid export membrane protein
MSIRSALRDRIIGLEQRNKINLRYLLQGGGWLTIGQGLSSVLSFVLAIAFANLLPKESYGTYRYVISWFGILSIATLPGLGVAVTRATARGYDGTLKRATLTYGKWGIVGTLAGFIVAATFLWRGQVEVAGLIAVAACFVPLYDLFNMYDAFLQGKKRFDRASLTGLVVKFGTTAALIVALLITKNLFAILISSFVVHALIELWQYRATVRTFVTNNDVDETSITYAKHLSAMNVLGTLASQLDRLLIFSLLGPAQLAIYSIAIAPGEQIKGLLKTSGSLALPRFAEQTRRAVQRTLTNKIIRFSLLTGIVVLAYIIIAPFVFPLVFPAYSDSVGYSQLYALSLIPMSLVIPISFLQAHEAKKELYVYNISSYILQCILLIILIPAFGLTGAILARILSRTGHLIISGALALRLPTPAAEQ